MTEVVYALSLLTPFDIDIPKVRLGPPTDGGYVFANCLSPDQSAISYGINGEYRFDEFLAARGHKVYMFDHTIDGINKTHDGMIFLKEGVDATSNPDAKLYTIDDHLSCLVPGSRDAKLSREAEEALWQAFFTAAPEQRREFEPNSKRRKRRRASSPSATG